MISVNGYLIAVISPSEETSVQVLDGMSGESNLSEDFQLPIQPRNEYVEEEMEEEAEIKKTKKEGKILIVEVGQKQAVCGLLSCLTSAVTSGLGLALSTTSYAMEKIIEIEVQTEFCILLKTLATVIKTFQNFLLTIRR